MTRTSPREGQARFNAFEVQVFSGGSWHRGFCPVRGGECSRHCLALEVVTDECEDSEPGEVLATRVTCSHLGWSRQLAVKAPAPSGNSGNKEGEDGG